MADCSFPYEDILSLPHPTFSRHTPMSNADRAAQFAPFAALTGHGEAICEAARLTQQPTEPSEDRLEELDRAMRAILSLTPPPLVSVTHFVPDAKKAGGAYTSTTGHIIKLNRSSGYLLLREGHRIPLAAISDIQLLNI